MTVGGGSKLSPDLGLKVLRISENLSVTVFTRLSRPWSLVRAVLRRLMKMSGSSSAMDLVSLVSRVHTKELLVLVRGNKATGPVGRNLCQAVTFSPVCVSTSRVATNPICWYSQEM